MGQMKCVQCKKELGLKRKLISCDGDFVCNDKCHDDFHKEMDTVVAQSKSQYRRLDMQGANVILRKDLIPHEQI